MDSEKAKRRADIQRDLMLTLMDMQADAAALEKRLETWKKRWLASHAKLDDAMDQET
jgi:hypothetical protein